jgi:hypothetical protein
MQGGGQRPRMKRGYLSEQLMASSRQVSESRQITTPISCRLLIPRGLQVRLRLGCEVCRDLYRNQKVASENIRKDDSNRLRSPLSPIEKTTRENLGPAAPRNTCRQVSSILFPPNHSHKPFSGYVAGARADGSPPISLSNAETDLTMGPEAFLDVQNHCTTS